MSDAIEQFRRAAAASGMDPAVAEFTAAAVREFCTTAVMEFGPYDGQQARVLSSLLSAHLLWCLKVGYSLDREIVFRREIIAEHVERGLADKALRTKATARSKLFAMSDALLEGEHRAPRVPVLRIGPVQAPYDERELTLIRSWAAHQRTDYRRVNAAMLLGLSLGAGLTAQELCGVRAGHIHVRGGAGSANDVMVVVEVIWGLQPRYVPIYGDWEEQVAALARAAIDPNQFLFLPRRDKLYRRNMVSKFTNKSSLPFPITTARLRATWIVDHIRRDAAPLGVIARAAGITSADGLADYIAYARGITKNEARRIAKADAKTWQPRGETP